MTSHIRIAAVLLAAGATTCAAHAEAIFSNVDSPWIVGGGFGRPTQPYAYAAGDNALTMSQLQVVGGGALQSLTFSAGHFESGTVVLPVAAQAQVFLYLDDGDNNPDDNADLAPDADNLLFQSGVIDLPAIASRDYILHTLDMSSSGVVVPDGATLWAGVSFTNTQSKIGQVIFNAPAVGSTTSRLWEAGSVNSTFFPADHGFGFELNIPAPATASLLPAVLFATRRRR